MGACLFLFIKQSMTHRGRELVLIVSKQTSLETPHTSAKLHCTYAAVLQHDRVQTIPQQAILPYS